MGTRATRFPAGALVSVPSGMLLDGTFMVFVRIGKELGDVAEVRRHYGQRLGGIEIAAASLSDDRFVESLEGLNVRVRTSVADLELLGARVRRLRRLRTVFRLPPDDDLLRCVTFLGGFDLRTHVDASLPPRAASSLQRTTEYFLHNPLLIVPVEPLQTLLVSECNGARYDLWDTEYERIGRHFHVSPAGSLSLSPRWEAAGFTFGTLDQPWESIQESAVFLRIRDFPRLVLRERVECMTCPFLNLCGGYLRALDADSPCGPWKDAMAQLREASRDAKELIRSKGRGEDGEG